MIMVTIKICTCDERKPWFASLSLFVSKLFKVSEFVDTLFKLHEKKLVKKTDGQVTKEKLFDDDETEKINLMIGSIKLPSDKRHQIIKM
jgi:hypothetical protein